MIRILLTPHSGHASVVQYILDQGIDVDTADNDGWTPLHYAAQEGYVEVMKILLARGAQVDQKVSIQRSSFLSIF